MKKLVTLLAIIFAVNISFGQKYDSFGDKIKPNGAISTTELSKKATEKPSVDAKVTGVVESVCQAKGCWMKVKLDDGKTMRVTFKDYGFFVPKDIAGKTIIFAGNAQTTTTSVDELRHYAEDAGKSKDEVAKITEPKTELTFEANGVLIPKN